MKYKTARYKDWFSTIFIGALIGLALVLFIPVQAATPTLSVIPPVQLDSTNGAVFPTATTGQPQAPSSCFLQNQHTWIVIWLRTATTVYYSYSASGTTWSTGTLLLTWSAAVVNGAFSMACNSNNNRLVIVGQLTATTNRPSYAVFDFTNVASPTSVTAETQMTGWTEGNAATKGLSVFYDASGNWDAFVSDCNGGCASFRIFLIQNGAIVKADNITSSTTADNAQLISSFIHWEQNVAVNTASINVQAIAGLAVNKATRFGGQGGMVFGGAQGTTYCASGDFCIVVPAANPVGLTGQQCYLESFDLATRAYTEFTTGGIPGTLCGRGTSTLNGLSYYLNGFVGTDGIASIWAIFNQASADTLLASQDNGANFASSQLNTAFSGSITSLGIKSVNGIVNNQNQLQMLVLEDTSANGVFVELITGGQQSLSATSQTQTIGECPTKNTAIFTPANNTIYLYSGNALANEVVNTLSTSVASVTSGTHTFQLLLYVSTAATVSVISPLNLAFSRSFSVTAGTVNQIITVQVNTQIGGLVPIPAGATFGVGLVADDHFRINQSSTSGLTTLAGNAATQTQPATFSTTGTSNSNKLYLCAKGSYQSVLTITSTTTTTQAATTTVSTTQVISSTVLVNQANPANAAFWFIPLLFLMLPTAIFLAVAILVQGRRR